MQRGEFPAKVLYPGNVDYLGAFLGGGAGVNGTIPANGVLTDNAAGLYPKQANMGLSLTRTAIGLYTAVFSDSVKNILFADGVVVSDGAAPTAALKAIVTKITPGANSCVVAIFTPAGVAADLGTSDLLIVKVTAGNTSAIN